MLTVFLSFCYIYKDFVRQLKAFPPSFCHFCACKMSLGWGHLITWMDPSVGHLNGILARVGGNLSKKFQKSQMPGGCPGGHVEASIWPIHNVTIHCSQLSVERTVERSEEWDSRLYLTAVRPKRPNKEGGKRSTLFYFEEKGNEKCLFPVFLRFVRYKYYSRKLLHFISQKNLKNIRLFVRKGGTFLKFP